MLIEATVKDSADHTETRGEPITVSESPLIITAVPEGGTLIPNLENQVFVMTAYPDGAPAVSTVKVHADGNPDQSVATDDGGVAVVRLRAGAGEQPIAHRSRGQRGQPRGPTRAVSKRVTGADQILLRTERAVYRAGDRIALRVFSTKPRGTAYVDVVKEGQTVLTRDLDIVNGQAELALTATPDLAGTLDLHRVSVRRRRPAGRRSSAGLRPAGRRAEDRSHGRCGRYKPGDEARMRFRVTNARGEGVQAALGVQVVDEAVFALAEKQPGFAKVFFYLEQEAMKPRYEIHSLGMPEMVAHVPEAQAAQHDRAARALFAATEMVNAQPVPDRIWPHRAPDEICASISNAISSITTPRWSDWRRT